MKNLLAIKKKKSFGNNAAFKHNLGSSNKISHGGLSKNLKNKFGSCLGLNTNTKKKDLNEIHDLIGNTFMNMLVLSIPKPLKLIKKSINRLLYLHDFACSNKICLNTKI